MDMNCSVTYRCGEYAYEYIHDWIKWPSNMYSFAISGIVCRSDDIIVSTRDRNYPIVFLSKDGDFIKSIGKELDFNRTHGLTLDRDGSIWICDDQNSVIYNLDLNGEVIHQMGEIGKFSDNGYDPTVRWPHDLYTIKRAGEPFNRPTKWIQSSWGDYYCSDGYGNVSIHRFSEQLELKKTWGGPGNGKGEFRLPHTLAIDENERIWVCDRENARIEIFDKDGEYISEIDKLLYPSELWNHHEHMYLCEGDGQVSIYNLAFEKEAVIGYPGCFTRIHSIGGDAEGNLFLGRIEGNDSLIKLKNVGLH